MLYPDFVNALRTSDAVPIFRALLLVAPLVIIAVIAGYLLA